MRPANPSSLPRPGHLIIACALGLLTLGVVMVTSAGMTIEPSSPITLRSILLSRLTVYFVLALATLAAACLIGPSLLRTGAPIDTHTPARSGWSFAPLWLGGLALVLVLALVYVPGLGVERNGAHRWLSIPLPGLGDLSIQPSEVAKWGLIAILAWYTVRLGPAAMGRFFTGLLPALLVVGLVAGVVVLEDLGTAALIALVAVILLLASGARLIHFALLAPAPLLALAAAIITHPYRLERIRSFLDPYADPNGAGYHMIQSMIAVANGEVFGRGLGHGLQKFGYLPEDTTDFIFAIICEELGVAGAILVCALYVGIAAAGISIVRAQRDVLPKLLGLGVVATVGFQALINLAVVTALGPTKGIALPLLSSGGTGWLLTAAALGLLAGLDRAHGTADRPSEAHLTPAPPALA